jgi:hypothetical protein
MTQTIPSGRYWATVKFDDLVDDNAVIGYDGRMETYFFHSGRENNQTGAPLHWFGRTPREFMSYQSLEQHMKNYGIVVLEWQLGSD